MVEPTQGAMEPRPLHPDHGSGEAGIETVTDEIDEAQPQDATAETEVPSGITRLGVEARAEYIRTRQKLGLVDEPVERLGTVGRYQLEAELGRGGMGIVFRASDPDLDRPVAIKLVQAVPFARYDKLRTRLLREGKVLAKLTHPNVVRVYDCGQHEGEVYLAMELVEGATLRDWQGGRSRRSILDAYQQAARGLAEAHELEITHRDFKPDNVMVAGDGRVLVGDFGLAGAPAGDELRTEGSVSDGSPAEHVSATRSGALLGTPTYMAPEQLRGKVATPLSDQFAFCVSLWEALTGLRPFEGEKREKLLEQIEKGRVRGAERLPRRLRRLLLRGLAVEPGGRFEKLRDLADALVPLRSRVVTVAALSVTLVVGVAVGKWLLEDPAPPCELPSLVDAVKETPGWKYVQEQPELGLMYEDLQAVTQSMRKEAEALCQASGNDRIVRQEWLKLWIDYLDSILESSLIENPDRFQQALEFIEKERRNAPPPRSLDKEVVRLLKESYTSRLGNELDDALEEADDAVVVARSHSELALVHLWRGRVLALSGSHPEAMIAYRKAIDHAHAASYTDALLVIELLMAKTAVMRLGELERARDALAHAHGLMDELREPLLSPRRAAYNEDLAAVLKDEGAYDAALGHQWYALFVYGWWGDELDLGMGFVNLGVIYELRGGDSGIATARFCYERAFEVLEDLPSSPDWLQAAFHVSHSLVPNGSEEDRSRARKLLRRVRAESKDVAPSALTELVLLEIYRQDAPAALDWARELEAMLDADARSGSPSISAVRRLDAWQNIASAHSLATDLAGFEAARATFESVGREALDDGALSQNAVDEQMAALDLTAAFDLEVTAPEPALDLAISARNYFLSVPEANRDATMTKWLDDANGLIAKLGQSTSSATPH